MSARAQAMGYASSCMQDEWSIFNNVAGLSAIKHSAVSFTYHAYPSFKPFNRMAAVVSIPTKISVMGVGAFRYGDMLYNEQLLTAGFANKFGIASLGARINYVQYQAEGFGSSRA